MIVFSLCTKDLKGGGVRDVSSCFYSNSFVSSTVVKIAESTFAPMCLMQIIVVLSQFFYPACKEVSVEFLMVNFKDLLIQI